MAVNILQLSFGYEPSTPLAVIATIIFALIGIGLSIHVARRYHRGDLRWGWCLPVGTFAYMIGFAFRPVVKAVPTSIGLFIVMQIFLVTSPAAFLAFNYIIFGRFVRNRVGEGYTPKFIPTRRLALIFLVSDYTTFSLQGNGGGLTGSSTPSVAKIGTDIVLAGLILQVLSYIFFVFLVVYMHRRIVNSSLAHPIRKDTSFNIVWLIYFSSIFIMIRGIYRTIEFGQGTGGFLITHEIYFYVFDALPLLFAIIVFVPFWPGRYIEEQVATDAIRLQSMERV